MQNGWRKLLHYYSALGAMGVLAFLAAKATKRRMVFKRRIRGIKYPIWVRLCSTDASVLKQVLIERQYDFSLRTTPRFIIDAGANIGMASVFFANRYPEARILAIEPDEGNFQMLEKNVAPYPQILPMKAALWSHCGEISLIDPGMGDHGYQTVKEGGNHGDLVAHVPSVTVESSMTHLGAEHLDILKLDIEGAEKEVLENADGWLERTDVLMIELHEHLRPGCLAAFASASKDFPDQMRRGETVLRAKKPAKTAVRNERSA